MAKVSSDTLLMEQVLKAEDRESIDKAAVEVRKRLLDEWQKGANRDYTIIDERMDAAKVLLTKMQHLSLVYVPSEAEFLFAREILEFGVKASVTKISKQSSQGLAEFDNYISQLKHYYFDLGRFFRRQSSESMYEILGMNLLNLLSQNRIAEFHTELELFVHSDVKNVMNNVYIKKAVEIEQFLTEGRYHKILALLTAKDELKSSGFRFFIERIVESSREVIADVLEKAYEIRLPKTKIQELLNIQYDEQLIQIAKERNWTIQNDYVYFANKASGEDYLQSLQLAIDCLKYAKELDTIV